MPEQPSFAADIRPLFRDRDVQSKRFAFDLSSYDDVRTHGEAIYGVLAAGRMPCDGAWAEQVGRFRPLARHRRSSVGGQDYGRVAAKATSSM